MCRVHLWTPKLKAYWSMLYLWIFIPLHQQLSMLKTEQQQADAAATILCPVDVDLKKVAIGFPVQWACQEALLN